MKEKFNLKEGVNLGKTSWLGVGGACDLLFKPQSEAELVEFLDENTSKITILGNTSNLIISDDGIEGVVIRLMKNFAEVKVINEDIVEVGSGMLDKNFANLMMEREIAGFEFLSTIPGNIGGGIKMNCGCFGGEIAENLLEIIGFDFKGKRLALKSNEINFSYRSSNLPDDFIITSAILKGARSEKSKIYAKMEENQNKRNRSQPTGGKTAGSTFKNPEGHKAWELLEEAGLRGVKIGGASFSEKHLNFLINDGTATAKDLINLGELGRKLVFEKFGINLEWEVKRLGKF